MSADILMSPTYQRIVAYFPPFYTLSGSCIFNHMAFQQWHSIHQNTSTFVDIQVQGMCMRGALFSQPGTVSCSHM